MKADVVMLRRLVARKTDSGRRLSFCSRKGKDRLHRNRKYENNEFEGRLTKKI